MADFTTAYHITSKVEGGYSNDPDDNGGETYKGIARKSAAKWQGWPLIDTIKDRVGHSAAAIDAEGEKSESLQALVLKEYKTDYWDALSLDQINDQRVANELYDTAVNMGTGRSSIFFQRVLNIINRNGSLFDDLKVDGQIGDKSIAAFNTLPLNDKYMVWKLLNCLQGAKYIDICEANPKQEKFMRSWACRVFETIS